MDLFLTAKKDMLWHIIDVVPELIQLVGFAAIVPFIMGSFLLPIGKIRRFFVAFPLNGGL